MVLTPLTVDLEQTKQRKLFREPSRQIRRTCARDDPTQRHASGRQIPFLEDLPIYIIVGSQIRSSGMRPGTHYRPQAYIFLFKLYVFIRKFSDYQICFW